MKEKYQKIIDKYREKYFRLEDRPSIGTKIVYLPTYGAMIYALYDGAYDYFKTSPGDILTVKKISRLNASNRTYSVYFQENKFCTTPAELVLFDYVDKKDIDFIKRVYCKLRDQKLKRNN